VPEREQQAERCQWRPFLPFYYFYFLLGHSIFSLLPSPSLFWIDEITPLVDDKPFLLQQGVVEIENFIRKDQPPLLPFYSFLLLTTLVLFQPSPSPLLYQCTQAMK
jgi:hypothetical protein